MVFSASFKYHYDLTNFINEKKILPKDIVVHRITGDGAKKSLVAPLWSADKKKVLNFLKFYLNMH